MIIFLLSIASVTAEDNQTITTANDKMERPSPEVKSGETADIPTLIDNSAENDEILVEPGTYKVHNLLIDKNITIQGNGNPRDIIFDGEQLSSIILIRNKDVHVTFKNITFINGLTNNFGGAISMETGNVYVDNCIFKNNVALQNTNAGAISNYGTMENRAYLFVNNSLFIDNHADHDGGAITTCYAYSEVYNSIFINNSANRDGGAIRVSVFGATDVTDCIFMYNYAREWGGAFYSWACNSNIDRCIFMNNTAGTNGGAVMVSGNMTLTNSIIVNNTSNETGGSFYIQQPMFDETTTIRVKNNLITNNTSPLGKEVYIYWNDTKRLFTYFNDNDWGDEDPTDSSVIDPTHTTPRSKVTRTIKSNLLNILSLNPLNRYSDLLEHYYPEGFFDKKETPPKTDDKNNNNKKTAPAKSKSKNKSNQITNTSKTNNPININSTDINNENNDVENTAKSYSLSNSSSVSSGSVGDYDEKSKASEITKKAKSVSKSGELNYIFLIIIPILMIIGFAIQRRKE